MVSYKWQDRVGSIGDIIMPSIFERYMEKQITADEAIEVLDTKRGIAYKHIPDDQAQLKESINDLCVFYTEKIRQAEAMRKEEEYRMYV